MEVAAVDQPLYPKSVDAVDEPLYPKSEESVDEPLYPESVDAVDEPLYPESVDAVDEPLYPESPLNPRCLPCTLRRVIGAFPAFTEYATAHNVSVSDTTDQVHARGGGLLSQPQQPETPVERAAIVTST